jgi:hypothetical protein
MLNIKPLLFDIILSLVTFFFLFSGLITIFSDPFLLLIDVASTYIKLVVIVLFL